MNAVPRNAAQVNFLRWVAKTHPGIYARHVTPILQNGARLNGLGWITAVVQAVATVGAVALQKKQQDQALKLAKKQAAIDQANVKAQMEADAKLALLQLNASRAEKGLNPVDSSGKEISSSLLPSPASLKNFMGQGSNYLPYLVIGGGVIVAFLALRR